MHRGEIGEFICEDPISNDKKSVSIRFASFSFSARAGAQVSLTCAILKFSQLFPGISIFPTVH